MIIETTCKLGGKFLVDPSPLANDLRNAGYHVDHFLGKANSFTLPIGFAPGRGYVLMEAVDYEALISAGATTYRLELLGGTGVSIYKIVIDGSEVIDGSNQFSGRNVVLVRIADIRAIGHLTSIDEAYNVQVPMFDGASFYKATLNGGAPWTWTTMLQDMWSFLPGIFGALDLSKAALPTTKPDSFDFKGWECWKALESALSSIDRTVQMKPDGSFHVIVPGNMANNSGQQFLNLTSQGYLVDHGHNSDNEPFKLSEKIRVFFPNKTFAWHTSTDQFEAVGKCFWRNRPFKSIDIATGGLSFPGTVLNLHSSLYATYDNSEAKLLTNESLLNLEAQRMADSYADIVGRNELEMTFSGYHSIEYNGDVTSVAWFDFGIGEDTPQGAFTSITRFPRAPRLDFTSDAGKSINNPLMFVSPERYPGPADLATQHLDVEYIAVVKAYVDIPPLKAGKCHFLYGKSTGEGEEDFTDWQQSALPHYQIFHNYSTTKTAKANENYLAVWIQQRKRWVVCVDGGAGSLTLLQARDWMQVGSAVAVDVWKNVAGNWEPVTIGEGEEEETVTAIAQDITHSSFLAPGDMVWGHAIGTTDDGFVVYEILGENGLEQTAKALANTACGASNDFEITVGNPDKDPTIQNEPFAQSGDAYLASRKESYTEPSCPDDYQRQTVIACVAPKGSRTIFAGEYCHLSYIKANRKWRAKPVPELLFARGLITSTMCFQNSANVTNIRPMGLCGQAGLDLPDGTADNAGDFNLAGVSGSKVFLLYAGSGNVWHILQVQHWDFDTVELVIWEDEETFGDCPPLVQSIRKHNVMTCEQDPHDDTIIEFESIPVITGFVTDGCDIEITGGDACVVNFRPGSNQSLISTVDVDVVSSFQLFDSGAGSSGAADTTCELRYFTRTIKVCAATSENPFDPQTAITFQSQVVLYNIVDTGDDILGCFVEIFTPCIGDDWCDVIIETDPCPTSSS